MYELLERDDLQESKKIESISKELVIAVLSDEQKLTLVLSSVNEYLASEVSFVKSRIDDVEKPADLERLDAVRKSIAKWRVDAGKNYTAIKKANKDLIAKADDGFELVVSAQKNAESEIEQALAAKKQEFEQERLRKKALSDAVAKLKAHAINPLLPAADIETAIDDFRLSFGDTYYQESQSVAESIFESKVTEFETILSAAVVREENERKIKEQEKQAEQRANINITFPIAEISGYAARSSVDIQSRIDWTNKVDMSAFESVLSDAEIAKQSCLNMLAAFLPMAVDREAKAAAQEAADKAVAERLEREKQYQDDWDLAIIENQEWEVELEKEELHDKWQRAQYDEKLTELAENKSSFVFHDTPFHATHDAETANKMAATVDAEIEAAVIAIINDDAGVAKGVAKIIGETAVECDNSFSDANPAVFEVNIVGFDDLNPDQQAEASNNGCGKEYASYLIVKSHGEVVLLESDAMEPEDATFGRDLNWISSAIQMAFELGVEFANNTKI